MTATAVHIGRCTALHDREQAIARRDTHLSIFTALVQRLQAECAIAVTARCATRALTSAFADLRSSIHADDIEHMAFTLASSRLSRLSS